MPTDSELREMRTAAQPARLVDVNVPFGTLVELIFKVTLAAIPALVVFGALAGAAVFLISSVLAAL